MATTKIRQIRTNAETKSPASRIEKLFAPPEAVRYSETGANILASS